MNYAVENNQKETEDQRKSAIITALVSLLVFLLIYFYTFSKTPDVEPEAVTTMLINFGDNRNGNQVEEPANQEGSIAASEMVTPQEQFSQPANSSTEKLISGNNTKISTPKSIEKKTNSKAETSKNSQKSATATKSTTTKKSGDGKGNAAIGNLLKGRGQNPGSQGTNGTVGNDGDPLGGDGNGDSKIGIDRKLVDFIPGTMGRGGNQPANNCTASGTINISFTVDKAGNVVSARRSSGISDACVASTSVAWVKKYVKAERANTSSTGSYKITF
ncbi:ferric siderophore ABC transporter substrate-binding protein [Frigoriflavimonas asaccharolytica]|uniref:Outer membrane biosynthesis protein TonB n=1 Tax=Frigoriflavimonas asaccharolytica TaxID=2735899 RepID=A0A8J8G411_9FLAO|nr:ferric siderophore ABC transporter substrate-binding protein [Frigoriflavimonas asaccharolytica]NRS91063.1 outer membrane biosynthesis protein TonB [Frigoriflavimonas asaccharolytica]